MWWDKKWVLACPNFGERTARVKLELTDFKKAARTPSIQDFKAFKLGIKQPNKKETNPTGKTKQIRPAT